MPDADAPSNLPYSSVVLKQLLLVAPLCTYREFRVLMAYACRAGPDGVAWPSADRLATDTGLPKRHVSAAVKSLLAPAAGQSQQKARLPLLETIDAGGGTGNSARRRLLISGDRTMTDPVTVQQSRNPDRSGAQTVTGLTQNPDRSGAQTVTGSVRGRRKGRSKEEGMEDSVAAGASAGAAESGGADKAAFDKNPACPSTPAASPRKAAKPTGDHAEIVDRFTNGWKVRYKAAYPFRGGRDGAHVKSILAYDGVVKAREIVDAYLADADPFVAKSRHSLGVLISRLALYITAPPPDDSDADDPPVPTAEQYYAVYEHEGVTMEQCQERHEKEVAFRRKACA